MYQSEKNRFNEKKPFDVVRAEDFGSALYDFYEPLEHLIRKASGIDLTGSRPIFLIGGRGTGKTMVLKYLSFEMQIKAYLSRQGSRKVNMNKINGALIKKYLKSTNFVGIYLHFRTTEYDSLKDDIKSLFIPYFSIKLSEQLFNCLACLKDYGVISREKERDILNYYFVQISEPIYHAETFRDALNIIKNDILHSFENIFEKSAYYSFKEIKSNSSVPIILAKNVIYGLADKVFKEVDILSNKHLFILLDELEFLNDYQVNCIGKLLKDSDETSIIFKIGSRYMPPAMYVGESSEVLQDTHDFRKIDITDALNAAHSGKKNDYSNLIIDILNKRLAKSNYFREKGIKKITQLFPNIPMEQEARELVKNRSKHWNKFKTYLKRNFNDEEIQEIIELLKYQENPIIEKLNMLLFYRGIKANEINRLFHDYLKRGNKEYKLLYSKNALNLLFHLYNDYRTEKKYTGINVFIHLSSGIIRNAVEICNEALNNAYNYGFIPDKNKPIKNTFQDMGAKHHSMNIYNDIKHIPGNLGFKVQSFINEIGSILRQLHLNLFIIEPEPTHFETIYSEIFPAEKKIFDSAIEFSYLQRKPSMNPKSSSEVKKDDFLLNRIFAPFFEISYRVRGRTIISSRQIMRLISGNLKERKQSRKEIIRQNIRKIDKQNEFNTHSLLPFKNIKI